jgi:hypothetical protein
VERRVIVHNPAKPSYRLSCECCGQRKKRVWGFISKDGDAHAIYYALFNVEDEHPRMGLTLSVGPWWDGTQPLQRYWLHLKVWRGDDGVHMSIRDPQESNFYPREKGGTPLSREDAKSNGVIDEIWSVADFIIESDIAVSSYLAGNYIDSEGREERDADSSVHSC